MPCRAVLYVGARLSESAVGAEELGLAEERFVLSVVSVGSEGSPWFHTGATPIPPAGQLRR